MLTIFSLLLTAQAAAPVEVRVTDPDVIAMVLKCPNGTKRANVKNGLAVFQEVISGSCTVHMVRRGGVINGPGKWTCGLDECTLEQVAHRNVRDEPGRLNIILTSRTDATGMEVKCPSGHRERQPINNNTVVFNNIPNEDGCELLFKGGAPLKYRPINWGTYNCQVTGGTVVCIKKSAP